MKLILSSLLVYLVYIITAVVFPYCSGYMKHFDTVIYYNNNYSNYESFDDIYSNFIKSYKYKKINGFRRINRLFFNTVENTYKLKSGECFELSSCLVDILSHNKIPARVVIGRNINHTWIQVYINNQWLDYDPTDDIYRYSNNLDWGFIRNYEYKVLLYI